MKDTGRNKLRSARGASLSFALLLFLVCAVIGSVVLAAGTAAAGRMSQLAQMDQRYYSVTSAAELFGSVLDGQSVTIVRTKATDYTTVTRYTADAAGNTTETPGVPTAGTPTYDARFDSASGAAVTRGQSFLADRALDMVFGAGSTDYTSAAAWDHLATTSVTTLAATTLTLTHDTTDTAIDADALEVTVEYTLQPDGSVTLVFANAVKRDGEEQYRLKATYTAVLSEETRSERTPVSSQLQQLPDDGALTVFEKTAVERETETKITTLTWTLSSLEKVES